MTGPCGYGRYDDDASYVGCPRAKSDMTPCIARDGHTALHDKLGCVYCDLKPGTLIRELADAGITAAVEFMKPKSIRPSVATQADKLAEIVRAVTDPDGTTVSIRHTFPCGCSLGFEDETESKFIIEICGEEHLALWKECKPVLLATSEVRPL